MCVCVCVCQTAMQLLEKSVHEKQDTIVRLRKQLEEMKTANIKMTSQIKVYTCLYTPPAFFLSLL